MSERIDDLAEETTEEAVEDARTTDSAEPLPKKRNCKKLAIAAAVVVVIAAIGIGFWQWHETPEFCTAICHTPMDDAYRQTLYANPHESSTDKWGNRVERADAMLASTHGASGMKCMACHVPVIEEQVAEACQWASGDYRNPMSERDLARLVFCRGVDETEFCLNGACHDITKTRLAGKTAEYTLNPHSWHHSEYTCGDCHKAHRASVMVCTECHDDAKVPDGWLTAEEAKNLEHQTMSWNEEQSLKSQ